MKVLSELPNWKTLTLVEIMISFILVIIIDYERSTPHSIALILLNLKKYIFYE